MGRYLHFRHAGRRGLGALILLGFGLVHGRLIDAALRHSALRITDEGITVGFRRFRSFSASWPEIARIDVSDSSVRVVLKSGRTRKLNLTGLRNADEIRTAIRTAATRLEH